jgi:hypothetical protein
LGLSEHSEQIFLMFENNLKGFKMITIFLKFDYQSKEQKRDEIYNWINDSSVKNSFVGSTWYYSADFGMMFHFKDKDDAILFKLRWA